MIIARGFQGVGISMFPIAFSIIRDQFPREKMAIGQGIITSMFAGGAVIGLSIGVFIIQHYVCQATFFTIIPIVIALFFTTWHFIHLNSIQSPAMEQQQESVHTLKVSNIFSDKKGRRGLLERIKNRIGIQSNDANKTPTSITLDIKGAITLAIAITSFLLVLTYLQTGNNNNSSSIWLINFSTLQ